MSWTVGELIEHLELYLAIHYVPAIEGAILGRVKAIEIVLDDFDLGEVLWRHPARDEIVRAALLARMAVPGLGDGERCERVFGRLHVTLKMDDGKVECTFRSTTDRWGKKVERVEAGW
jgi:hypothetical protein